MTTPNSTFKVTTFVAPAVSAVSAGVFSLFSTVGDLNMTIVGYQFPAPLGIALITGVSSLISQVNKDYFLPMLGFSDVTTWNSFYIGTALLTGVAVSTVYVALNLLNGQGVGDFGSVLMMGSIGVLGAVVGQWANGMTGKADVINSASQPKY